jgi:hypothetical protein
VFGSTYVFDVGLFLKKIDVISDLYFEVGDALVEVLGAEALEELFLQVVSANHVVVEVRLHLVEVVYTNRSKLIWEMVQEGMRM